VIFPGEESMTETEIQPATDSVSQDMVTLVKGIARALVDSPESVSVEAFKDGDGTLLRLRVGPTDVGKVIGKQGRTARSLRTILSAASMKMKHRFTLDIVEDHSSNTDA
jgi:predicted RNA-binding protein YlqC (UPF0109 family)